MRITLDIDDGVLREARQAAAAAGVPFGRLVEDAVRAVVNRRSPAGARDGDLPVFHGRGLRPGVNLADAAGSIDVLDDDAAR